MKGRAIVGISRNVIAGILPGAVLFAILPGLFQPSGHADVDLSYVLMPFVAGALAGGIPACISLFEGMRGGLMCGLISGLVAALTGVVAWLFPSLVLVIVAGIIDDGRPADLVLWVGGAAILGWASAFALVTARGISGLRRPARPKALYVGGALGGLVAGSVSALIDWAFALVDSHDTSLFILAMLLGVCVSSALAITDLRAEM